PYKKHLPKYESFCHFVQTLLLSIIIDLIIFFYYLYVKWAATNLILFLRVLPLSAMSIHLPYHELKVNPLRSVALSGLIQLHNLKKHAPIQLISWRFSVIVDKPF